MRGPRTSIIIRKTTRTNADGGWTDTWSDVETITSARVRAFTASEKLMLGRDTSIELKKCYIPYKDVTSSSRTYLAAKQQIRIGTTDYDIDSAELREGRGQHYELLLRRVV